MAIRTDNQKKKIMRMKRYFIEMTGKLIQEIGIENVTIRKVANEVGYNSATIYNYFDNFDQLLLYASFKYLKAYTQELSQSINESMNAMEKYIRIFRIFCKHTFAAPEIFMNMFYGKYSNRLDSIVMAYYSLFPDEIGVHSELVMKMLSAGNIFVRERLLVEEISKDGYIKPEAIDHIVEVAIWSHECLLHEMCLHKNTISVSEQSQKYEGCLKFVLRLAKIPGSGVVPLLEEEF